MNRRHHYHIPQSYTHERYNDHSRGREKNHSKEQARGIEFQDDSLSSINSDEESYNRQQHGRDKNSYYTPKTESTTKTSKNEKSGNQDSSHQKENKSQAQHSSSNNQTDSTTERLGRLEAMLAQLIKKNVTPESPVSSTVVEKPPNDERAKYALEPRRRDFTTSKWINKIQETSVKNNWDEKTTISYMGSQMSGVVRAWYNSLPSYDFSWPEWKILITKVFPDNTDFVSTLKRLVTRVKHPDETMATYYFSKMFLIEACKITGEDAVSCIIDGLNNQDVQEQAKQLNFMTPEMLYSQFLMNLPEYNVNYRSTLAPSSESALNKWYYQEPPAEERREDVMLQEEEMLELEYTDAEIRDEDLNYQPVGYQEDPVGYHEDPDGYHDDPVGYHEDPVGYQEEVDNVRNFKPPPKRSASVHERLDKRYIGSNNFRSSSNKLPLAARVCTICSKRGHLARNCRLAGKIKRFKLLSKEHDRCFYKRCFVNEREMIGFIDTGCTTITLREKEAKYLNLDIRRHVDELEVYGGGIIHTIGDTFIFLEVDSVKTRIRAVVVPNHIQDVAIIIGQDFINKKNINMFLTNGTLTLSESQL